MQSLAHRLVALVKSLLGKGSMTDFQVRQWGIRRTWKSVVPLNQQAVTLRVMNSQPIRDPLRHPRVVGMITTIYENVDSSRMR